MQQRHAWCDGTDRTATQLPSLPLEPRAPLEVIADAFADASPALIAERELLSRIDTKYVVPVTTLGELLADLGHAYAAIRSGNTAWAAYQSTYFDTPDLQCFHDHRRGRRLRHKIRIRHYPARALSFLELKTKCNDLVTTKHRLALTLDQQHLAEPERAFLRARTGLLADVVGPVLHVDYRRLSLVGRALHERVTIDVDMDCTGQAGEKKSLGAIAIVEIKRAGLSTASPMAARLARTGYRECSISKYIAAVTRLRPDTAHNRLLPSLRALHRIG
ncbi:MAG: polyphosphate polymerase domain-containing protein [Kofleriaceae bacterium]|nr:polyphosphate polymerase domain-containing protein [Kofleriaceae bacterium]